MKPTCSLLAVVLLASMAVCAAEDFKTALQSATSAEEALPLAEKYVKEHPDAADIAMAEITLGRIYSLTGDNAKAVALLEKRYTATAKGKEGNAQEATGATAGLVSCYLADGDKKQAGTAIKRLEDDFKDHPDLGQMARSIAGMKGQLELPNKGDTMEIAFTALDGHPVDLASMKGKVVLVDFWATWCGPCVGELPNVKKAYEAYHEKGFDVIGISLDQEKDTLEAFLKKEAMAWPQAFDGKGWQSEIATKFGIHSIPATFLIGKDGKVVATNLRGDALEKKLAVLLK